LKREEHRQALLQAATSGNPKFFLGNGQIIQKPMPQGKHSTLQIDTTPLETYRQEGLFLDDLSCCDNDLKLKIAKLN